MDSKQFESITENVHAALATAFNLPNKVDELMEDLGYVLNDIFVLVNGEDEPEPQACSGDELKDVGLAYESDDGPVGNTTGPEVHHQSGKYEQPLPLSTQQKLDAIIAKEGFYPVTSAAAKANAATYNRLLNHSNDIDEMYDELELLERRNQHTAPVEDKTSNELTLWLNKIVQQAMKNPKY